jgi:lactoylglutathione lyase
MIKAETETAKTPIKQTAQVVLPTGSTSLHVANLERSISFYERHFGFKDYFHQAVSGGPRIAYLKLADTVLELTERPEAMSGFHFCLETDDFDGSVAKLQAEGVALLRAPHDTAAREPREKNWRRVVFRGPDGEQIELRG